MFITVNLPHALCVIQQLLTATIIFYSYGPQKITSFSGLKSQKTSHIFSVTPLLYDKLHTFTCLQLLGSQYINSFLTNIVNKVY